MTEKKTKKPDKTVNKLPILIAAAALAVIVIAAVIFLVIRNRNASSGEVVYREQAVEYGELTVGVTEEGSVAIGTSVQSLDIDITAFTGSQSFSWGGGGNSGGGMPGGGGMGGGMPGADMLTGGSSSSDSDTRQLEVQEVYVSVGEQIRVGTPIARLNEESVTSIRADLEADVAEAQNVYDQAVTDRVVSDASAEQDYQINNLYGSYAETEYESALYDLQENINSAEEALDEAQQKLTELQDKLSEDQVNLAGYKENLSASEAAMAAMTDRESYLYDWIMSEYARESAESLVETTEDEIEDLTDQIRDQQTVVDEAQQALVAAQKAYAVGAAGAKQEYDNSMLYYSNADEYHEVTLLSNELSVEIAQDDLEEAKEKLEEFNETIQNNEILSVYDGVVADVLITVGDDLYTGSTLLVVNDYDEVTVTVDVDEDDIASASLNAQAKVTIPALASQVFDAVVTDVGEATYDSSSGSTYYEVEVQLSGDTSSIYSDMTAEVTFITRNTETVLYIPNRAVSREKNQTTVKVRTASGGIENRKITTGFSDGTNVEVTEGLSEGEIVLIESKVETR